MCRTKYFHYGEKETAYLKSRDKKLAAVIDAVGPIRRELDTDLKDPDERLRIQILLKAMQIQKQINERKNSEQ